MCAQCTFHHPNGIIAASRGCRGVATLVQLRSLLSWRGWVLSAASMKAATNRAAGEPEPRVCLCCPGWCVLSPHVCDAARRQSYHQQGPPSTNQAGPCTAVRWCCLVHCHCMTPHNTREAGGLRKEGHYGQVCVTALSTRSECVCIPSRHGPRRSSQPQHRTTLPKVPRPQGLQTQTLNERQHTTHQHTKTPTNSTSSPAIHSQPRSCAHHRLHLLRLVDCVPGCDPGGEPARICCRRAREAAMSARRSSTSASRSCLPAVPPVMLLAPPPPLLLPFWLLLLADNVALSSRCGCCCRSRAAAAWTSSANSRMRRGCSASAMLRSAAASSADSVRCLTATVTKALV